VPVSLAVSQPAGPAGDDAGFVFIARDMTERRQAEEERRRLEAQLQRSQKLEGLGGLAGRIAHDFNNLFGGIFGYIILGRDAAAAGDAPAALEHLTKTLVVFDRAKRLTQQILTFARGGELARKPIALAGKLRKAAEIASYRTGGACTCDIAPDLGTCEADEQQLGQVLDALLANAQEAAPAGSAIEVRAANAPAGSALPAGLAPGDYVCITIADHGCGIAPEHLSRVFEPFFTTKSGAAGLGLAIAYSVVKKHNGAIEVQSQPGAGTAFSVYLPAARQAPTPAAHPGDAAAPPRSKASGRILVMDDEDFMRDVARGMLTALGYSVETAGDGNEALALHARARAAATPFRAALLDLTVPVGVGGKDAAKRLRAVDRSIVLIASSGYSEDPVMARPAEFGFDAVLAKPYQQDDLARVLQEAFAARQ
jgi:signal transduction histidine kinase/CheY-like chemotaxis protein